MQPLSAPPLSCVPLPTDPKTPPAAETRVLLPKHGSALRARISSLEPPPHAYLPKSRAACGLTNAFRFCFHFTRSSFHVIAFVNQPLTAADLHLASLIARGIAANLSHHAYDPTLSLSDKHLLLCERLQALLSLHGRRLRVSSATRMSTGIVPPTYAPSVLSTPAPSAPLCFIATARRARSRSHASAGAALEMPAPAATLLLRRREGNRQTWAGTRRMLARRASRLSVAS